MSYELQKPITNKQRAEFISLHHDINGLSIEDTEMFLFALEPNEMMGEKEIPIEVPDYETVPEEYQEPVYADVEQEDGYFIEEIDHYETKTREVQKPILDENGEQVTHTEIITIPYPVINPNYEEEQEEKERERIKKLQCTKRVFALMLQELGITYAELKTLIATNEQAQLEWDLCVELQRENPLLDVFGQQLGITPEQIDLLFRAANGEIPVEQLRATNDKESEEK